MNAFTAWPDECTISVVPSGGDLATALAPIVPPAPGRFSITTVWPHISLSFWPIVLARMSVALPAVNGTTIFTGLVGKSCADASVANPSAHSPRPSPLNTRLVFISGPFRLGRQAIVDTRVLAGQLQARGPRLLHHELGEVFVVEAVADQALHQVARDRRQRH